MSHRQNSKISPSSVHSSYRFWTVTLSFCRVCQLRMKNVIDSQGFGNLKDYRFWPVTISFCKVKVKPQNANWVQDYMAVRSLLPVAHILNPKPYAQNLDKVPATDHLEIWQLHDRPAAKQLRVQTQLHHERDVLIIAGGHYEYRCFFCLHTVHAKASSFRLLCVHTGQSSMSAWSHTLRPKP